MFILDQICAECARYRRDREAREMVMAGDLARELGKERSEVLALCIELGVGIVDGRVRRGEFMAALGTRS